MFLKILFMLVYDISYIILSYFSYYNTLNYYMLFQVIF